MEAVHELLYVRIGGRLTVLQDDKLAESVVIGGQHKVATGKDLRIQRTVAVDDRRRDRAGPGELYLVLARAADVQRDQGVSGSAAAACFTRDTRRTVEREARCSSRPFDPPENTIRVLVAFGSQPCLVRCRLGSIFFHSPPTLARTGEEKSCFVMRPSGRAHVEECEVRAAVTSMLLPVLAACARAEASVTVFVCPP